MPLPNREPIDPAGENPNTGTITYGESPTDEQGRKYVDWPDGSRFYLLPQDASQRGSGGMIHNPDNWNPKTGQWEPGGVNWGALIPWLGLAAMAGSAALAFEPAVASLPSTVASEAGLTGGAGAGAGGAAAGGIGETGAVTGLTGSGFAGEAGGIGASTVGAGGIEAPIVQGANSGGLGSILGNGSTSSKILKGAKALSPILSGASKSAQDANQNRDRNAILAESNRLNRNKFALEAPSTRMSQSLRASLLTNFKPSSVQWGGPGSGVRGEIPQFEGGSKYGLQNLDPSTKDLLHEVMRKTLADQLSGQDNEQPDMKDFGHESIGDKLLGYGSAAAGILGGLGSKGYEDYRTPPYFPRNDGGF